MLGSWKLPHLLIISLIVALGAGEAVASPQPSFQPFTGQIKGQRVRMRLHADRDSTIIDEMERGELIGVVGEQEEFYEVLPPKSVRAFVFRSYILDNRVQGNRVNVRLQPSLDSPVIAQLSDGDLVDGTISQLNNKWIEVTPPASTRFYIAKEFVDKVGDAGYLSRVERRVEEATDLVNSAYVAAQVELHKPYEQLQLDPLLKQLQQVVEGYSDVPQEVARASYYLTSLKDALLQKKIAYLEAKAAQASESFQNRCNDFAERLKVQQSVLDSLEEGIPIEPLPEEEPLASDQVTSPQELKQAKSEADSWEAREKRLYEAWQSHANRGSMEDFYENQRAIAEVRRGIIQPYTRPVPKKPGNYLLIDPQDSRPVAFLYSSKVDLQPHIGHLRTLHLFPRPNNQFAFPAFFVLSIDER